MRHCSIGGLSHPNEGGGGGSGEALFGLAVAITSRAELLPDSALSPWRTARPIQGMRTGFACIGRMSAVRLTSTR